MNPTQPTPKTINNHLASMRGYCYVFIPGRNHAVRIARARTRHGVVEGRVICGSPENWIVIPEDATIELN